MEGARGERKLRSPGGRFPWPNGEWVSRAVLCPFDRSLGPFDGSRWRGERFRSQISIVQSSVAEARLGSRRAFWTVYAAAFASLILFYAAPFLVGGASLSQAIRNAVAALLPNALLGVIGISVPPRLPWRRNRLLAFLTAHAVVLITLAFLATGGWMALAALDSWVVGKGFAAPANRVLIGFQILISALA